MRRLRDMTPAERAATVQQAADDLNITDPAVGAVVDALEIAIAADARKTDILRQLSPTAKRVLRECVTEHPGTPGVIHTGNMHAATREGLISRGLIAPFSAPGMGLYVLTDAGREVHGWLTEATTV